MERSLIEWARCIGDKRYGKSANTQPDDHCPVYYMPTHHNCPTAIKVIAHDTVDGAAASYKNIHTLYEECSDLIVPIKQVGIEQEKCEGGGFVYYIVIAMQWCPLPEEVLDSVVVKAGYDISVRALTKGKHFNDIKRANYGCFGFFDVDSEWGPFKGERGTYATHSTLILLWLRTYCNLNMPPGDPNDFDIEVKADILADVASSKLTQVLIFADFVAYTLSESEDSADADLAVLGILRRMIPCEDSDYLAAMECVYRAYCIADQTNIGFSHALAEACK